MIAAFATLAFLTSLWLIVVLAAATLEDSWSKIVAALGGRSPLAIAAVTQAPYRVSARPRLQRPVRARPHLRAAA